MKNPRAVAVITFFMGVVLGVTIERVSAPEPEVRYVDREFVGTNAPCETYTEPVLGELVGTRWAFNTDNPFSEDHQVRIVAESEDYVEYVYTHLSDSDWNSQSQAKQLFFMSYERIYE